jgi:branched-chain amino acid transport system ATP-binding protein
MTLEISGLTIAYGRTEAVRGIDLSVATGKVVALIGANGAGKTTILRTLSGLLKPRAGRIVLDGENITGLAPHRVAARGMVQVPEGRRIFSALTVADNLTLGAWTRRHDAAERRDAVLARFPRLRERLHQLAGALSGGEQQMLAIGRALMAAPKMLLLDEPSMGLAPLFVEEIFAIIAALKADGVTILLVEQNAFAALEVADTAYVLEVGRITLSGPASRVATDPAVVAAYLGG